MKILAIRIKNLASIDGICEIDFTSEPLCSAGIYAITGPTGAGKSTILDALCLALYAKTPRYCQAKEQGVTVHDVAGQKISQNDVRGILRDGTGDGYAEVDFVGIDQNRYRSRWTVKRAHNKVSGALQNDSLRIENLETGLPVATQKKEACREVERLVGLSFEQFTRSVLLAQGDFTAFLKAEKDEKASLLEKLTGTHIYSEISKEIYQRHKLAEEEVARLKAELDHVELLDDSTVIELSAQSDQQKTSLKQLDSDIQALDTGIRWHERLSELVTLYENSINEHQQHQQRKVEATERFQLIERIDEIQAIRPVYENYLSTTKRLQQSAQVLERVSEQYAQRKTKLEQTLIEERAATLKRDKVLKDRNEASPLIIKARELDVRIQGARLNYDQAQNVHNEASVKLAALRNSLKKHQQDHEASLMLKNEVSTWIEENDSRRSLAENINLISSKLSDAKQYLAATLSTKETIVDESIRSFTPEELRLKQHDTLERYKLILHAQIEWHALQSVKCNLEKTDEKLKAEKAQLSQALVQLSHYNTALSFAEEKKVSSERRLRKAEMQVAEDVEAIRSTLVDGEPCPVCGSIHHPYLLGHPVANSILTQLSDELKEDVFAYDQLHLNRNKEDIKCSGLQTSIQSEEKEFNNLSRELHEKQVQWQQSQLYTECSDIADEDVAAWMTDQLNNTRQLQHCLEQQLNHSMISRTCEELNKYFPNRQWTDNWKTAPDQFLLKLQKFSLEWKERIQRAADLAAAIEISDNNINNLSQQEAQCAKDEEEQLARVESVYNNLQLLVEERKSLLDGLDADDMELRLSNSLNVAESDCKKVADTRQQLEKDCLLLQQRVRELEETINVDTTTLETLHREILMWLNSYNIAKHQTLQIENLAAMFEYKHQWVQDERNKLKQLEDAVIKSASICKDRSDILTAHRSACPSDKSLEELQAALALNEAERRSSLQKVFEIEHRLQSDRSNKLRAGTLLKTIQSKSAIAEEWARLNELIGSADGKKFRQLAQEYTLDVLLAYANVHLSALSNRYHLQRIPDTLALQVTDRDMGDEIRTVYSLSGGESFLVSLALALGLASLSSSKMKVESLFIDEGFGSLDPATLNIAMDALERLHNQGRKVGVISHVQEMTERISTQVKVVKISSGKSKIEVCGMTA